MKDRTLQIRVEGELFDAFTVATEENDSNKTEELNEFMKDYVSQWESSKPQE